MDFLKIITVKQILYNIYHKYWKKWGFFGDYPNWASAMADCSGYDTQAIFEKVKHATLQVKDGKAAYERDSFLFYEAKIQPHLIEKLNLVQNTEGGVRVLDFGGALGSTYFQHREILSGMPNAIWCIVEQPHFVDCGKKEFENDILKFELTIEAAIAKYKPNFVLFSSVLQYLEHPYAVLKTVFDAQIPYIYIDRTPFLSQKDDRIVQQITHPKVYEASYTCWLFSKEKMVNYLCLRGYNSVENHKNVDKNNILDCTYEGFFIS
jgi:putative methyltransferase (TIGR04325 family)